MKLFLITTPSQLQSTFGIASENYPGLLVAQQFLVAGGAFCFVCRVAEDPATAAVTITNIDSSTLVYSDLTSGSAANNETLAISYGSQLAESVSASHSITVSVGGTFTMTLPNVPVVPGTVVVKFAGVQVATDDAAGNVVFAGDSTYPAATWSGTVNYNTGAVVITATSAVSPGLSSVTVLVDANYFSTFTIQVLLRVYDNDSNLLGTYLLETNSNLTLANIVAVMANSQYISIPNAPAAFPVAGRYDLTGGDDGTSSIHDSNYIGNNISAPTGMQVFADSGSITCNVVLVPGVSTGAVRQALIQLASVQRGDAMCILDPPADTTVQTVADWANGANSFSTYGDVDSTYAAIYYPWYSTNNSISNSVDLTPPSAAAMQAFARSAYWQAPAGPNRGTLQNFAGISVALTTGDRAFLGTQRINPIANLNNMGTMVLGQYTATQESTSLDRVGARMTLLALEKAISTAAYSFLFEPNAPNTWQRLVNVVQPYLNSQVSQGFIYAGQIFCDAVTNIPQNVNNNVMVAVTVLELLKYAEIIVLNFQLESYGVTITEALVSPTSV